jgi:sulfur-oxidizing protein SoxY
MNSKRREILQAGGSLGAIAVAIAAGLLKPGAAHAQQWHKAAFESRSFAEILKALGGAGSPDSKDIVITAPEIAENGAVVPIAAESKLAKTQMIALIVDKNPNPLVASFDIPDGTDPFIATRVKMAETSNIFVLVKADGRYYHSVKEVKVTLGGCGG